MDNAIRGFVASTKRGPVHLAPFLSQAAAGGVLVVGQIKAALDQRLGRPVALASAHNLLRRHGWRKRVPDKPHPQSDPVAQED